MTQSNKISNIVAEVANSSTAVNLVKVRKIPVVINVSGGLETYVKVLVKEQERIFSKDVNFDAFDADKLTKYLKTALKFRILDSNQVETNDDKTKAPHWMTKAKYDYPLPAFFYVLTAKIGVAISRRYALKFTPELSESLKNDEWISREDFEEVRAQFKELRARGVAISKALPRGDKGDFDFMALNWTEKDSVNDKPIQGFTKARPDYAFYRSLITNEAYGKELMYMYVMTYDVMDEYKSKYRIYSDRILAKVSSNQDMEVSVPKAAITEQDEYVAMLTPDTSEESVAEADISYKSFE